MLNFSKITRHVLRRRHVGVRTLIGLYIESDVVIYRLIWIFDSNVRFVPNIVIMIIIYKINNNNI